ncbi:hypothetical protein SAMD00019534_096520 [Acytostelium subglobosum LB1]|uniref:hypothetical protein n=1 Tax=Acytostelium subglobosum LB1 TaxID=1410327 RepID=UPI00064522B3|nr:hypothetical protein SAMD00019534_096520 [Acytostelium subglobosum LB1]GAM26477.1 hypothetical protein SAMD00019534_096520 [Acytostelium subglobosum LB1]|eukprot:XP_012750573.1 hypothetical protein SAMD00019534_096520 [Acytostelium subglobosum LB1]
MEDDYDDMSSPPMISSPSQQQQIQLNCDSDLDMQQCTVMAGEQEYIVFCIDLDEEINSIFKQTNPRLDHIKKALWLFVRSKLRLDPTTKFAICILRVSAIWYMDFTGEIADIKSKFDGLKHGGRFTAFDMTTLFDTLDSTYRHIEKSKHSQTTMVERAWNMRVIFIYSRSGTVPQYFGGSNSLDSLKKHPNFQFESIYMYHHYHVDHSKIVEAISQATKNISKISDQSSIRKFYYCFLGILFVPPSQRPTTPKYQRFPVGLINENLDKLTTSGKNQSNKTPQPPVNFYAAPHVAPFIHLPHPTQPNQHIQLPTPQIVFQLQAAAQHQMQQLQAQQQAQQQAAQQQLLAQQQQIHHQQAQQQQAQEQAQQQQLAAQIQNVEQQQQVDEMEVQDANNNNNNAAAAQTIPPTPHPTPIPTPTLHNIANTNVNNVNVVAQQNQQQPPLQQQPQPLPLQQQQQQAPHQQQPEPIQQQQQQQHIAPMIAQIQLPNQPEPHNPTFSVPVIYYPFVQFIQNPNQPHQQQAMTIPIQLPPNLMGIMDPAAMFAQQQQQLNSQQQALRNSQGKTGPSLRSSLDSDIVASPPSLGSMMKPYVNSAEFSDVRFLVGKTKEHAGEHIYGHKMILSARSKYFKALFTNGMRESEKGEIVVPDVSKEVFLALLAYLYTDDLAPPTETATGSTTSTGHSSSLLTELLILANQFLLDGLKVKCCELIGETLSTNNLVSLMSLASIHEATELKNACIYWFYTNLPHILRDCCFENDNNNDGAESLGFLIVDYFSKVSKLSSTDGKSDDSNSNPEINSKDFEELVSLLF